MISLTNYDFQWARSELVIIYPEWQIATSGKPKDYCWWMLGITSHEIARFFHALNISDFSG